MEGFIDVLLQPIKDFWTGLVVFLPNLLAMLIIIAAGFLIAWLIRVLILRLFKATNFDVWCDAEGVVFSDGLLKSLEVAYLGLAEDTMVKYEADAAINGLVFDRHEEAKA